jgi:flagellar motility protein MotE (MotC chaperone)
MADEAKKTTPPAAEKPKPSVKEPGKDHDKEAAAPDDAAPVKTGKKFSPVLLIVVGLAAFVVFLAVFSYMMGVFSPKPPVNAEAPAETTPAADSAETQTRQFVSDFGRAAAAVEAAQQRGGVDTIAALSELDQRHKEIVAEEARLQIERQELAALKGQVEQLLSQKKAIAGEKVLYLAKLLDGMKQDELAGLMGKLDDKTILAVLPSMKPQTASKVLALLPPERAAQISTQLLTPEP